jgi:hypothetical protein
LEETPPVPPEVGLASADNVDGDVANNWCWIFDETIAAEASPPSNLQNLRDYTTTHELGHQLNVNDGNPVEGGHDAEQEWGGSGIGCLMNDGAPPDTPGVSRFHDNMSAPSQDLFCVRTHVDDLNEDECPPFPGTMP